MNVQQKVTDFHEAFDAPVGKTPALIPTERAELRYELMVEELDEFFAAMHQNDLVGIADALGDLAYVVYGAAVEYGIQLDDVIREIHESNMSKLGEDGLPIHRADGKVLKGPGYWAPRLDVVLEAQGWEA